MTTYRTSTGERLKKSTIDHRIREAKKEVAATRPHVCQATYTANGTMDMSHVISVDRCQKIGKAELAYDTENIEILRRDQHLIWENGSIEQKAQQRGFRKRLAYIQKHDPEKARSMELAMRHLVT